MDPVQFSIIVPFYNKEKTLATCIESLINQSYPREGYEIILIDNDSTDNSPRIARQYPSVRLLQEKKRGAYAARNAGILAAHGVFLVFTDADVEVPRDWLANISNALIGDKCDILLGWEMPDCSSAMLQMHRTFVKERIQYTLQHKQFSNLVAATSNATIKKEIFGQVGLFREVPRSEDIDFVMRCAKQGYRIAFSDAITVTKHDIDCVYVMFLKLLNYGCAKSLYINEKFPIGTKLLSAFHALKFTVVFLVRRFPKSFLIAPCHIFYFTGYCLGKSGILGKEKISNLVARIDSAIKKQELRTGKRRSF